MDEEECYGWEEVYRAYGCSPVYSVEDESDEAHTSAPTAAPRSEYYQSDGFVELDFRFKASRLVEVPVPTA
ncbi:MAG: hypothetical protein V3U52_06595 [Thermoplasmata archaeon]